MNSRPCRFRIVAWSICAAALLCATAGASAQAIYKRVDAAGRITYTDRSDTTPSPESTTVSALAVTNALASNSAISSRGAAMVDANEATRRLGRAQLERELGVDPLPGEQAQGIEKNVANHRYWRRQEKLQQVLDQARHRYSETRQVPRAGR